MKKYFIVESHVGPNLYDVMKRQKGYGDSCAETIRHGVSWKTAEKYLKK